MNAFFFVYGLFVALFNQKITLESVIFVFVAILVIVLIYTLIDQALCTLHRKNLVMPVPHKVQESMTQEEIHTMEVLRGVDWVFNENYAQCAKVLDDKIKAKLGRAQ